MPNSPKVLHVTFDMAIGGTEQVIKQIIEGSIDDCQHEIYCIDGKVGDIGKQLEEKGIVITAHERHPGLDTSLIKHLRAYIKNHNIDIVHCHQYTPYFYGVIAAMFSSAKLVFTEHGRFYPDVYSWKRRLLNPIFTLFTSQVISISKATKEALIHYEWFPNGSIDVIYNGIDPAISTPSQHSVLRKSLNLEGKKVLGTVARMDSIKNHEMMLKGFASVIKQHPNTALVIVGDGPERAKTEQIIEQLQLKDSVILTGFQPKPSNYFGMIDIFLLPSLSEGTSMTLLEAMANGKPAVVTNVGGNPEIVEHESTGLICESGDVDTFAKQISSLLSNPELYEKLKQRSLERFNEHFTLAKMTNEYLSLYRSL